MRVKRDIDEYRYGIARTCNSISSLVDRSVCSIYVEDIKNEK